MKHRKLTFFILSVAFALVATLVACKDKVQQKPPEKLRLKGYFKTRPWTKGTHKAAMKMALAGQTIPLAQYSFTASKDGQTYSGVVVGTSPFATPLAGSTINAVVVPLKVSIGSATFDAGAGDACDGNVSSVTRFQQSPLANDVPNLTINGVNVGNAQFINGFRRAEFWTRIKGSAAYQNELNFTFASPVEITAATVGTHGITAGSGCGQLGVLSIDWLDGFLQNTLLPSLTSSGVVSPNAVALFLLKNIVQSDVDPPTTSSCCILGYHSAVGTTTIQTYGTMDWDTSGAFSGGVTDASISSHEIGEWMDDPLGNNATPPWGNVGQVSGCQNNWETGDPLSGNLMPAIVMNGKSYQMQELGFFSWYFNKAGTASVGAGGKFSSNGTFQGASMACPPGGTN
jgi:hypothetical protein